jgi:hypothetical protein
LRRHASAAARAPRGLVALLAAAVLVAGRPDVRGGG